MMSGKRWSGDARKLWLLGGLAACAWAAGCMTDAGSVETRSSYGDGGPMTPYQDGGSAPLGDSSVDGSLARDAGSGARDGGGNGNAATFTQVMAIFKKSSAGCTGSSCHSTSAARAGLSLQDKATAYSLLQQNATDKCTDKKRVDPGNPAASVLYLRLTGSTCGGRMPENKSALSSSDLMTIQNWISAGAPNN